MTLFTGLMLPLVVSLGLWQLDRAEEKRLYEDRYYQRLGEMPVTPAAGGLEGAEGDFLRVRLDGRYDPLRYFLIDNQIQEGKVGYQVIGFFQTVNGRRWLINRGWVPGPESRERLPDVTIPEGLVSIVGVIWPELGLTPLLQPDDWTETWPKRVQRLDVGRMAGLIADTAPLEVRLEQGSPGVFVPARLELVVTPAKHLGYAAQWLGLSAALAIGYLIFGFRKDG